MTAITRSRGVVFQGQSYGREGYESGDAYAAFMTAISRVIESDAATIQSNIGGSPTIASGQLFQAHTFAVDGSAILQVHEGSTGYWVANGGASNGPLLIAALAAINALAADPIIIIDSHGEQDATAMDGDGTAGQVRTAWEYKLAQLRAACNAGTPTDVPVWVDILGIRYDADEADEYALRDAQLAMIDAGTNIFRGAEKYAAVLDDSVHPAEDLTGYGRLGAWLGRKVAAWLVDGSDLRGPSIAGAVLAGSEVTVSISVPAGGTLIKPDTPDHFGLFDAGGNRVPVTGFEWSGDDLILTAAGTPTTFRYPVREERRTNINRIVRLEDPADPIFDGEPGFPLESCITVAL